jgi:ribosomal protein S18 acetylase RimI-like enzyme
MREYGGDQAVMRDDMQRLCAMLRVESFYTAPTAEETGVVYVGESGERSTARWQLNCMKAEQRQSRKMHQSGDPVRAPSSESVFPGHPSHSPVGALVDTQIISLVAVLSADSPSADTAMHRLPSSAASEGRDEDIGYALGMLEVLLADRLPGEELVGDQPLMRRRDGGGEERAPCAYVFNCCVSPRARRRRVGSQLISRAVARASELGVRFLYLHVHEQNAAARHLYEQHGFECEKADDAVPGERKLLLVRDLYQLDAV